MGDRHHDPAEPPHATRRTVRPIVQTTVALAVLLPAVVDAAGIPATLPWVAGGLARVMALPGVQAPLPGWLRSAPPGRTEDTGGGST
ncbi:hypothetical protein [Streptomyces sp. WZ-12]|uniref:hypothetical protein n=1 Tax=Streptomyces sp. WZ-12 TaxID=3030210 RepID=UPI002381276D|nr:hypothetical protein [Streptomyces sp. WZ-12]